MSDLGHKNGAKILILYHKFVHVETLSSGLYKYKIQIFLNHDKDIQDN